MSVIPASHADLLDKVIVAVIATIGPDGEPQANPIWFDWDGELIRFSQTTTRQKYRNVQREPRVAITIVDPNNPYRYLEVRGQVAGIDDDPDNAFIDSLAQKYLGEEHYPWHQPGDERVVVKVHPEHVTTMG